MENKKLELVIETAIQREEDAYNFYLDLSQRVNDAMAKETTEFLASEEQKHKAFLTAYRDGQYAGALKMNAVIDYKIADYLDRPDPEKNLQSKDVYLIAAHRELNSYHFYTSLAEIQPEGEVKDILLRMASEEKKHKEKVEYLYTNTAFPEVF
ncbi:MAG: ferritin family protein [Candidatus Vecturithrix sp.]|jgi:rubrerythrin|nr:ferritin family protein [Candidatus Vecturithrix sp.]